MWTEGCDQRGVTSFCGRIRDNENALLMHNASSESRFLRVTGNTRHSGTVEHFSKQARDGRDYLHFNGQLIKRE